MPTTRSKRALRSVLKNTRNKITSEKQTKHAAQLCRRLLKLGLVKSNIKIACYIQNDGEINLDIFMRSAKKCRALILLPRIEKNNTLTFHEFRSSSLKKNRFGILEPRAKQAKTHGEIPDIVLMPLVGFDLDCNRLGMGGGYYDRTFSEEKYQGSILIGVAHQDQQIEKIDVEPWDIRPDCIVTNRKVVFRQARARGKLVSARPNAAT